MKKVLFIIAALVSAAFVSCQKENGQEAPVNPTPSLYTLTVKADKAPGTKALADDGATTWAENEKVLVFKAGQSTSIGTLAPQSYGSDSALLKGTVDFTGISVNDKLDLLFIGLDSNNDKAWTYEGQVGTLADISGNFDYAKATVTVNAKTDDATASTTDADFVNQQSIVKFTLKDGENALSVPSLRISASSGKLVTGYKSVGGAFSATYGDIVVTPAADASEFYVALRNNSTSGDEYTLTAEKSGTTYYFSRSGITFANGHMKNITVKMSSTTDVYTVVGNSKIFGTDWATTDASNDMTMVGNGIYTWSKEVDGTEGAFEYKVVKNHAWGTEWPSGSGNNYSYTITEAGTLVITFDLPNNIASAEVISEHSYTVVGCGKDGDSAASIFGDSTQWDVNATANDMALQDDGTYLKTYAVDGSEGKLKFKVVKDHAWTNAWPSENYEYTVPCAGTLMISFDPSTSTVKAWMEELTYALVYSKDEWARTAHPMEKQADGTYKCTIADVPAGWLEFKVLKQEDIWIGDPNNGGNNFGYSVPAAGDLIFTFNPQTSNVKIDIRISNTTADAIRKALASAASGDVIEVKAGTYVESNENYIAFSGKEVTVKAVEGAEVIIQPQVPITISEGGKAEFIGVILDASRLLEKADWYEHLIYASDNNANNRLALESCEIKNFNLNKSAIFCSSSNKFASVIINNCYFHDIKKSCFFSDGESVSIFTMTNSTIANISTESGSYYAGVFDPRGTSVQVTVDHCTFYNCEPMSTDYGVITVKNATTSGVTVSNCILMMPSAYAQRGIYIADGVDPGQLKNNIVYNYTASTNGIRKGGATQTNCTAVDPAFKAAASNDFTLTSGSPALTASETGGAIGDPRWY